MVQGVVQEVGVGVGVGVLVGVGVGMGTVLVGAEEGVVLVLVGMETVAELVVGCGVGAPFPLHNVLGVLSSLVLRSSCSCRPPRRPWDPCHQAPPVAARGWVPHISRVWWAGRWSVEVWMVGRSLARLAATVQVPWVLVKVSMRGQG